MVTWDEAFGSAIKIVAYAIGFWVLGVAAIMAGYLFFTDKYLTPNIVGYFFYFIGALIILLSFLATTLKASAELIAKETLRLQNLKNPAPEEPKP